jgi:hypothetical protein
MPDNPTTTDDFDHLLEVGERRSAVIRAAKRFDSCMSEFEGDLACCHEDMDALFDAVEKLRKIEDAIDNG